ncbi:MrcB family domain-containing protein [Streptosporangium sp. NPDC001559]|uniref:MrcB family domain-containing protein n=1 Tax=Streptosporangium sp. NPDC001559 TaxID=3366187 RepID=UPI0036F1163F
MELRRLIGRIGETYDRSLSMSSEAQQLLRQASTELQQWIPAGYLPAGSGGKGAGAFVPWIAVFDPDETATARNGMYVVYLFAQDMQTVSLSLNQGVTELVDQHGTARGRQLLKGQADAIRDALPTELVAGLDATIDLRSKAALPVHYEYGNVLATTYKITDLPDESIMVADLHRFVRLYQEALSVREGVRQTVPGKIVTTVRTPTTGTDRPAEFKPKNAADYVANVTARTLTKSRMHETVVREYGEFLITLGLAPNTVVHPRDMTVVHNGNEWLIEVKMVRRGDAVSATREAIGQLLSYRHFLYPDRMEYVKMLAVFNEYIGDACVQLLETLNIASVWREGTTWSGSQTARSEGLCSQ